MASLSTMTASLPRNFNSAFAASWLPSESPSKFTWAVIRKRLYLFIPSMTFSIMILLLQLIDDIVYLFGVLRGLVDFEFDLRHEPQFYPFGDALLDIPFGAVQTVKRPLLILQLSQHAEIDFCVSQVLRQVDIGHGQKSYPRVLDLVVDD